MRAEHSMVGFFFHLFRSRAECVAHRERCHAMHLQQMKLLTPTNGGVGLDGPRGGVQITIGIPPFPCACLVSMDVLSHPLGQRIIFFMFRSFHSRADVVLLCVADIFGTHKQLV